MSRCRPKQNLGVSPGFQLPAGADCARFLIGDEFSRSVIGVGERNRHRRRREASHNWCLVSVTGVVITLQ